MTVEIREAAIPEELPLMRLLFREYAEGLGIDLAFQNFEAELESLPGSYMPPAGGLWVAMSNSAPAGCVAMRPFNSTAVEMKRLFVRSAFRGHGLGRRLAECVLAAAKQAGHLRICLDTLPSMIDAIRLYHLLGFTSIEPYYQNPIRGAMFFGRELAP